MTKLVRTDGAKYFTLSYVYERADAEDGVVEVSPETAAWAVGTGLYREYSEPVQTGSAARARRVNEKPAASSDEEG